MHHHLSITPNVRVHGCKCVGCDRAFAKARVATYHKQIMCSKGITANKICPCQKNPELIFSLSLYIYIYFGIIGVPLIQPSLHYCPTTMYPKPPTNANFPSPTLADGPPSQFSLPETINDPGDTDRRWLLSVHV